MNADAAVHTQRREHRAIRELAVGVLAGAAVGCIGSWLLAQATSRGWTGGGSPQTAILGVACAAYFGA